MASSDWVIALVRWFLFLSIVTATAVVAVRVLAHVGWWPLHATSVQVVAAATIGCVATSGARLLWRCFKRPVDATRVDIEGMGPSADVSRHAQTSVASFPADPAGQSMPHEWSGVEPPPILYLRGRVEATDAEEVSTGTGSASFLEAGSTQIGSVEDRDQGPNPGSRSGEPTSSSIESPPNRTPAGSPADAADHPAALRPEETPGDDAKRLAEVLNLYERIGFLPDGRDGGAILGQDPVDDLPPQRGLWDELVEGYGAASIDFDAAGSSDCVITLDSGDMVFFDPESDRWAWVVVDREESGPHADGRTPSVRSVAGADG